MKEIVEIDSCEEWTENIEKKNLSKDLYRNIFLTGFVLIAGLFVICWLPFFIVALLLPLCESCRDDLPNIVLNIFLWLGYINSCVNPIVCKYCLLLNHFFTKKTNVISFTEYFLLFRHNIQSRFQDSIQEDVVRKESLQISAQVTGQSMTTDVFESHFNCVCRLW